MITGLLGWGLCEGPDCPRDRTRAPVRPCPHRISARRRATFFQQYRLFSRFHAASKRLVLAWVNDEDTRHAYESRDDAYRVFRRMLESSKPADDWAALLAEARAEGDRLREFAAGVIRCGLHWGSLPLPDWCWRARAASPRRSAKTAGTGPTSSPPGG